MAFNVLPTIERRRELEVIRHQYLGRFGLAVGNQLRPAVWASAFRLAALEPGGQAVPVELLAAAWHGNHGGLVGAHADVTFTDLDLDLRVPTRLDGACFEELGQCGEGQDGGLGVGHVVGCNTSRQLQDLEGAVWHTVLSTYDGDAGDVRGESRSLLLYSQ